MYFPLLLRSHLWSNSVARIVSETLVSSLLAYFVARFCIAYSFQLGRLSLPSDFDDVVYLTSAQQWLNGLSQHGLLGNLAGLLNQHAPVSTAVAALSFSLIGPFDWSAYATNGVLLGLTLLAVMLYLKSEKVSLLVASFLALCLVDVPFFEEAVTEFRPDLFAGIVTAFCILLLFQRPAFELPPGRQFSLGLLFGLALLMKPSVFLASGFVLAAAVLVSYAGFLWEGKLPMHRQAHPMLQSIGYLLLGAMLVFGPYLLAQGREILDYAYVALFTLADVNDYNGTLLQHLSFYLTGPGGGLALGYWFWIGVLTMALRLAIAAREAPSKLPTLCGGYSVLALIYLVITLTALKHFFLGSMFYAAFSLFMVRDWAWLLKRAWVNVDGIDFPYGAVILAILLGGHRAVFPLPALSTYNPDENSRATIMGATQHAWDVTRDQALSTGGTPITILLNTASPVRGSALILQAERAKLPVRIANGLFVRTTDEFLALAKTADLVIVTQPVNDAYPGSGLGNEIQAAMAQNPDFRSLEPLMGGYVQFYERTGRKTPDKPGQP